MGSHQSVLTRIVFFLFERGKQNGGGGRLRRAYRRRLAAAGARGRGGEEAERLGEEVAQLVGALVVAGELGWQQSILSGGGGIGLTTNSSNLATNHPSEHDIVTVVLWGASGWRESTRGAGVCESSWGQGGSGGCDSGEVWLLRTRGYGRGC